MVQRLTKGARVEIRRLYETGEISIRAVAERAGVSTATLSRRAKAEGWHRAKPTAKPAPSKAASAETTAPGTAPASHDPQPSEAAAAPPRLPTRKAQKELATRLYRALIKKLDQMETRMANGEDRTAQDEERETRALGTMIRNFEKVTEAVSDIDRRRQAAKPASARSAGSDAERMRREIAERLERLHIPGNAPERSGNS